MKTTRLFVLMALVMQLSVVAADDSSSAIPVVDTSDWKCKYCEVEDGWSGEVEFGLGNVSDDSFKFGEYNGLNEKGGFFIGNANLYYRNPNASYLDLSVTELGLDSRSLETEAGLQGKYKFFLNYDELSHFTSDTAATPYNGNQSLTLPTTWVTSGSTAGMTNLATSLRNVTTGTERKRLHTGLSFSTGSPWNYAVQYHQDNKQGTKRVAGSFFFNTAQLIQPVDYVTNEIDASVSYNTRKFQANLAYYGSIFSNKNKSLTWENAYTPLSSGQLALPPDNIFHQMVLSAGYELNAYNRVSADLAVGRMKQDERLLPATQNTTLVVAPLPANTTNAEVDTINAKLKFISMATDKLRLSASYAYNDRDNKTPQLAYDWVTTDFAVATPRTNLPYSFTRSTGKLSAEYKLVRGIKLSAGYDLDIHKRTFQEVDETEENTHWGKVVVRSIEKLFLEAKISHADRDTSAYQAVSDIDPAENILLKKYNMADRFRDAIGLRANITPHERYTIGLNLDLMKDDYNKSDLGLTDSKEFSLNGDITAMLTENTSANFSIGRTRIESRQAGSQTFTTEDWSANNDDTFENIGIGMTHVVIEDKFDIGADYTKSRSTGRTAVSTGASDPAFPNLSTELDSLKIYANYRLNKMMHLRVAFWHESYDSTDWTLDGVAPDTIPNVLSLGEISPSYNINVVKLSMAYKF